VLEKLGVERALVVQGVDGLDEITTTGFTFVSELKDGIVSNYNICPEEFGIKRANAKDILGGTIKENANIIMNILNGEIGPKRDIVVINAAAALYVGKICETIKAGVVLAEELLDSGRALSKLQELRSS
ncbi:MAG: anthranilate phosphoribosyltransferase, partial [Clostridiaceae bacterium]|nr:anthranilate phosphoribosyltransferase [Clostridiaceae bacterium]